MAYKKGQLCVDSIYWVDGAPSKEKDIYLPHSCDEWVIGNKIEAQMLIDDLLEAIKQLNK